MMTQRRKEEFEARIEDLRAIGNHKLADSYQDELDRQQRLSDPAACEKLLEDCLALTDARERSMFLSKYSRELSAALDARRKEGRA